MLYHVHPTHADEGTTISDLNTTLPLRRFVSLKRGVLQYPCSQMSPKHTTITNNHPLFYLHPHTSRSTTQAHRLPDSCVSELHLWSFMPTA